MTNNDVLSAISQMKDVDFTAQVVHAQKESARREEEHAIAEFMTSLNGEIREAGQDDALHKGLLGGVGRYGGNFDFDVAEGSRNIHGIPILPTTDAEDPTLILSVMFNGFLVRYKEGNKHTLLINPRTVDDWKKSGVMGPDPEGQPFTRDSLEQYIAGELRMLATR